MLRARVESHDEFNIATAISDNSLYVSFDPGAVTSVSGDSYLGRPAVVPLPGAIWLQLGRLVPLAARLRA